MSDREPITKTIEQYADLQRIEKASDLQKEIENQKRILEAKLQAFGIVTDKIQIDRS